ncbi:MAG: WD40 repeat domain-containing protein, partial [Anaerolineae bacterium]|nr:WD40 repeat domain-containing protein [Anaerolineae bacterium]
PYKGLAAFREGDAQFYFGRETFVDALEQAVTTHKLVAVILGSSGSGKSSAIFAGLLPRLRNLGSYQFATFRPGTQPFYSLSDAVIELLEPNLSKMDHLTETSKLAEQLTNQKEVHLAKVLERILKDSPGTKQVLLVVDQFEELYTLCPDAGLQNAFIDELVATVETSKNSKTGLAIILLTMRADFMGQALLHRPFADALQEATLLMGPMTRQELHTTIEKPAELQGAAFEAGLVERILDDVGQKPGNLPLLEFTLTQLWERQTDGWLTHADYEAMGCVEGALAAYADQVFADLDENEQELARHVFVQLVQPGEGTEDTRRIATHAELGDESWKLIQYLADRRLVVTGRDALGRETAEVVHEALIQRWGRIWEWMNADRAFRAWQERLRGSLRQWQESGQDEGALLAGAPLAVAQDWLSQRSSELNPAETGYIQASQALQVRQQKERQRRRQWTIIGLTAGLVVSLALAAFAFVQRQAALRQASIGLASQALIELDGSLPERGVLLALEALKQYPYTPQAEAALARAVQESLPYQDILGFSNIAQDARVITWSPDGRYIAVGGIIGVVGNNNFAIADVATHQLSMILPVVGLEVHGIAWSPDSSHLALVTNDSFVTGDSVESTNNKFLVYDTTSGDLLLSLTTSGEFSLDWSPDGQMLLTGGMDGVCRLWDAETGALLHEYPVHSVDVMDVHFSPDGTRFASISRDDTVVIQDIASGKVLLTIGEPLTNIPDFSDPAIKIDYRLSWSPDSKYLAVGYPDGSVEIWDTTLREKYRDLKGHTGGIIDMDWSPDGRYIATNSGDRTVRLWEASKGRLVLTINSKWWALDFSPDSRYLATSLNNIRVWDLSVLPPILPFSTVPPIDWCDLMWSPDGRYLVDSCAVRDSANDYQAVITNLGHLIGWSPDSTRIVGGLETDPNWNAVIVDIKTGKTLVELKTATPTQTMGYPSSGWSPDGSMVASTSFQPNFTVIWNPNTGEEIARTPDYDCHLARPMFSPDSQLFVVGCNYTGGDTPLRIFDPHTGELVREIPSQDGMTISGVWSPDGKYMAVTYSESMVRIYDTNKWEEIQSFAAHTGEVWDVNWSPDGKRLMSGDGNGQVFVWDFATGQVVQSFISLAIYSVDWSPDGKLIVDGGCTNECFMTFHRAWQSTQELIDYAKECCVFRDLTKGERTQFGLP